jgi:hypothetical protein
MDAFESGDVVNILMLDAVLRIVEQLGVTGLLALIAYKLLEQLLRRDLTRLEAKLHEQSAHLAANIRSSGFEHEIRYARLHERRALAIADVYRLLARTDQLWRSCLTPSMSLGKSQSEIQAETFRVSRELFEYFDQRRVYFDREVADEVDRLCHLIDETFGRVSLDGALPKNVELHRAEHERIVSTARLRIEEELKGILGLGLPEARSTSAEPNIGAARSNGLVRTDSASPTNVQRESDTNNKVDARGSATETGIIYKLALLLSSGALAVSLFAWHDAHSARVSASSTPRVALAQPAERESASQAEIVCKQIRGTFSGSNFCSVQESDIFKLGGVPALPSGWMCANPPYDQDPNYGSCTNPQTKAFDSHYCVISGLPKDGCALVLRHPAK